jgi:hypothetical protein
MRVVSLNVFNASKFQIVNSKFQIPNYFSFYLSTLQLIASPPNRLLAANGQTCARIHEK